MTTRIRVAVRVRPFLESEEKKGYTNKVLQLNQPASEVNVTQPEDQGIRSYKFDHVFSPTTNQ